jgi:hypothetical protein
MQQHKSRSVYVSGLQDIHALDPLIRRALAITGCSRADPAVVGVQVDVAAADDGGHVASGEPIRVLQNGGDAD